MTIKKIFTVYDRKAQAYLQPVFERNSATLLRSLDETMKDEKHPFAKHPDDYDLYEIGEYDELTGKLTSNEVSFVINLSSLADVQSRDDV